MPGIFLKIAYYLLIAFLVGTAAQYITGYHKQRIFTTFLLGFAGVIAGDFLAYRLHLPHLNLFFFGVSLLWSLAGAIFFILIFRLLRGRW